MTQTWQCYKVDSYMSDSAELGVYLVQAAPREVQDNVQYRAMVVIAHSEDEARLVHPDGGFYTEETWDHMNPCMAYEDIHLLKVTRIDVGQVAGTVILIDWND